MVGLVSALTLGIATLQMLIRISCLRTINTGAVIPMGLTVHLTAVQGARVRLTVAARKTMIRLSIEPTLVIIALRRMIRMT